MWPPHPGNPGRILLRKPGSQISSSKSFPVLRCGVFISRVIKRLTSDLRSRPSPCRTETAGAGKTLPPTGSPRLAAWPAGPSGARRAGAQWPRPPCGAHPAGRIPRGRFAGDLRGCVKVAGTTSWELGDRRPWPWWAGGRTPPPGLAARPVPGLSPEADALGAGRLVPPPGHLRVQQCHIGPRDFAHIPRHVHRFEVKVDDVELQGVSWAKRTERAGGEAAVTPGGPSKRGRGLRAAAWKAQARPRPPRTSQRRRAS